MEQLSRLQIRQEIKKLNRLEPSRAVYQIIGSIYAKLTGGLRIVVGLTAGHEVFYRVRKTGGRKPSRVTELQAPPAELVKGYQRCNPPGTPMFYAASRRVGALLETRAEAGEIVYLSQWIGRGPIPVNRIFDSEENQPFNVENMQPANENNTDLIFAYLDTLFTKRIHSTFSDDYKFTSSIAQQLTTKFGLNDSLDIREDGCVALRYPSVLGPEALYNTAMHANFAVERLELLHVMELRITDVSETNMSVDVLDNAVNFDGDNINWLSNPSRVPMIRGDNHAVQFIFDGRKWNLRLHEGDITPDYVQLLLQD